MRHVILKLYWKCVALILVIIWCSHRQAPGVFARFGAFRGVA